MLIEIVKRTPFWVLVLFLVLLAFGWSQSRDRTVSRGGIAVLPVAMIALSLYGLISDFGIVVAGLTAWIAGIAIAVLGGVRLGVPRGVVFSPATRSFSVPGSWIPLALMMIIFFMKYAVGVMVARHLAVVREPMFVVALAVCYGFLSGLFLARAIVIARSAATAVSDASRRAAS